MKQKSNDDVLHTKGPPPDARISGFNTRWGNSVIFTVVGLAWTGFAVLIIAIVLRSASNQAATPSSGLAGAKESPHD